MKTTLTIAASAIFFAATSYGETAHEISKKFEDQKIAAVTKYIADNPEAKDLDNALSILIGANMAIGKMEALPDLLQKRYDLQPKGATVNAQLILGEIARPYIESAIVSDKRDQAKAFVAQLKEDLASHPQAAQIEQIIGQLSANLYLPGVGDKMEIAFTSTDGRDVDVSKMKNKVILLDFWATWCAPCVAEMPNVIKAYAEYKDKGFEVVGISLDEDKAALEGFIKENKMTWPQYFDGKGWGNEIAQRYGISSIPATFLVGKDGKIIASNLRGPDLEAKIKEALAK